MFRARAKRRAGHVFAESLRYDKRGAVERVNGVSKTATAAHSCVCAVTQGALPPDVRRSGADRPRKLMQFVMKSRSKGRPSRGNRDKRRGQYAQSNGGGNASQGHDSRRKTASSHRRTNFTTRPPPRFYKGL